MSDIFDIDSIMSDLGVTPKQPPTTEGGLFEDWTAGKMPKIHNCQYWLKHELYVYASLLEKNWIVSKPHKEGRQQVSMKELAKALLEYYCLMFQHGTFVNARAQEQGKLVSLAKFVDLLVEYPTIKKLIDNPHELI